MPEEEQSKSVTYVQQLEPESARDFKVALEERARELTNVWRTVAPPTRQLVSREYGMAIARHLDIWESRGLQPGSLLTTFFSKSILSDVTWSFLLGYACYKGWVSTEESVNYVMQDAEIRFNPSLATEFGVATARVDVFSAGLMAVYRMGAAHAVSGRSSNS